MIQQLFGYLFSLVFLLPSVSLAGEKDPFNGDQILYELSYAADFQHGYVARLTNLCTGVAAPFIVAKFPNPSFYVKRKLLGFRLGFISKNPYTGNRFNENTNDPRRPSSAAELAAKRMEDAANRSHSWDYLCDAYLWDAFEDYANAQLELTKYTIEILKRDSRSIDLADFLSDVEPLFARIKTLVNGDPRIDRKWSYNLSRF